jgi:hypothetical protein
VFPTLSNNWRKDNLNHGLGCLELRPLVISRREVSSGNARLIVVLCVADAVVVVITVIVDVVVIIVFRFFLGICTVLRNHLIIKHLVFKF